MLRFLTIVYLVIFSTYVLFTREPDFFDGITIPATIRVMKDSTGHTAPFAVYRVGKQGYSANVSYLFRSYANGDACTVIYEPEKPEKGAVYTLWGYWVTWQELLASIALMVVLFQIAKTITRNPTPEGLLSELEDHAPRPKPRRYQ